MTITLGLPEKGISRSVNSHNSNLSVVCDWIEASVLFEDEALSKTDVADVLLENEVYSNQDYALEFVDSAWNVLRTRTATLGGLLGPVLSGERITRQTTWQEFPAYAFCLAVSCGSYVYPNWARDHGYDYEAQGSLFERLTQQAVTSMLPGWNIRRVGWAPDNAVRLRDALTDIIESLNEVENAEAHTHVTAHAKELGLDILAVYSFGDNHASKPFIMIQCASGKDWMDKRHTPDLKLWSKIINFNSAPLKGFAIPYSFTDAIDFRKEATSVDGVFLDRYRLLNPTAGATPVWTLESLNDDLLNWVSPRATALPRANA